MRLSGISIIVLALCGCSPWPPHVDELTANFQRHSAAFEELADLFSASAYPYVENRNFWNEEKMVDLGSDVLRQYKTTEGLTLSTTISTAYGDGLLESDEPVDDPALIELINTIGLPALSRASEGERIIFDIRRPDSTDDRPSIAYMRDPISKSKLQRCEPSFRAYDCGRCKIDLDDDWYLFYAWSPPHHELFERYGDEGIYERYLKESQQVGMRSDEHWEDLVASYDACKAASEPVIDYRIDPWERS